MQKRLTQYFKIGSICLIISVIVYSIFWLLRALFCIEVTYDCTQIERMWKAGFINYRTCPPPPSTSDYICQIGRFVTRPGIPGLFLGTLSGALTLKFLKKLSK